MDPGSAAIDAYRDRGVVDRTGLAYGGADNQVTPGAALRASERLARDLNREDAQAARHKADVDGGAEAVPFALAGIALVVLFYLPRVLKFGKPGWRSSRPPS